MEGVVALFSSLDRELFFLVYHLPHNLVFNLVFGFLSAIGTDGFIWVVLALALLKKKEIRERDFYIFLVALIVNVLMVDLVFKNIFARPRPSQVLSQVYYLGFYRVWDYSFPSGHAASSILSAVFLGEKVKRFRKFFYFFAFLIPLSRIYLGAHYPLDIVGGAILGVSMGAVFIKIAKRGR